MFKRLPKACHCGAKPTLIETITYSMVCECGEETSEQESEASAIAEWNDAVGEGDD